MTTKHTYFLLSVVILLLTVFSCKKDKPEEDCTSCSGNLVCKDIQEVKDYFFFKQGSYWIYEEQNTGLRDTLTVISAQNVEDNYNFDVMIYSSLEDYYYHYWPQFTYAGSTCQQAGPICERCVFIKKAKTKPGDFVAEQTCFFFTYSKGEDCGVPNTYNYANKITIDEIYPSLTLGKLSFHQTVKIHELNTFMEEKQPTNHYYSKGVGLVKKELLDSNEVWQLLKYNIVN